VILEQAKGVLVGRRGLSIEEAFDWMRHHSRNNNVGAIQLTGLTLESDESPSGCSLPTI
jgi:hypothetical protein